MPSPSVHDSKSQRTAQVKFLSSLAFSQRVKRGYIPYSSGLGTVDSSSPPEIFAEQCRREFPVSGREPDWRCSLTCISVLPPPIRFTISLGVLLLRLRSTFPKSQNSTLKKTRCSPTSGISPSLVDPAASITARLQAHDCLIQWTSIRGLWLVTD